MTESWLHAQCSPVSYDLTFSHFLSLVEHIGRIEPRKTTQPRRSTTTTHKVKDTFQHWCKSLKKPIAQGHTTVLFRLLFPEHDARRTYDMQEARLTEVLGDALEIPNAKERLKHWNMSGTATGHSASSCLGDDIRRVVFGRPMNTPGTEISLPDIDRLLDELAAHSPFSDATVHSRTPRPRPRKQILTELYRTLTPQGASCMTQIILKDLRPLLYSLPSNRTTSNLLHFNSNALHELTIHEAMQIWNPNMLKIFRIRATLDAAAESLDELDAGSPSGEIFCPKFGVPVEIPKCLKGQGCKEAIETLQNGSRFDSAWAETKYDGERMQIHIDQTREPGDQIRIISKSKRDSTLDRVASHCIIQASLGLPITAVTHDELLLERSDTIVNNVARFHQNAILEAELVCYNESEKRIDEFWRIRSLLESTAQGARSRFHAARLRTLDARGAEDTQNGIHQDSLESNASDGGRRHFMLVFFDVLYLDGTSLLNKSYEHRRRMLERVIKSIPGFSMLAERVQIKLGESDSIEKLRSVMAQRIAEFEEGLVIKPACSRYNELTPNMRWIKLKKDYIPGLGDTLDLVLVGACWDKDRGRELRVGSETFTTFFIGAVDKHFERRRTIRGKVHIVILFSCSYGLSRQQLEELNWDIRNTRHHTFGIQNVSDLSYTFELGKGVFQKPAVLLSEPRLLEVSGAGFTKSAGAVHYELRFPRITKIWNARERTWLDGVHLEEFHRIACAAVGRDPPPKRTSDAMKRIWELPTSPGVRCPNQRQMATQGWNDRLASVDDRRGAGQQKRLARSATWAAPPSPSPLRVLAARSNLDATPIQLSSGEPKEVSPKTEPVTLDEDTENSPEAVQPSSMSPKKPSPCAIRLPVSPSPTPPPAFKSSLAKRRVSAGDLLSTPHPSRKRKSEYPPSEVQVQPVKPLSLNPSKRQRMQPSSLTTTSSPLKRSSTALPTLQSLLTSPRFNPIPREPKASTSVRSTQSMGVISVHHNASIRWSLDDGLFYIQPSTKPEPFSLSAGRYSSRRLGTLDALLWGIGWNQADTVESQTQVNRGFIFVNAGDKKCPAGLVGRLEALWDSMTERSRRRARPLFILSFDDLAHLYRIQTPSESKSITPIWSSCVPS